jgi:Ca2+-binding RTX toxin-like protein
VDYSGYGAAATIDVSGYAGNTTIVGSAFGDTITDNKGANTITGGAGADTFTFLDTNTGKTATTADVITDFNNAAGDKIDLSVGVNVGNYGEASYADFASFVTGANAADKAVMVGLIGNDGFVAVDYDTNGTVDFMIKLTGLTSLSNIDVASFI